MFPKPETHRISKEWAKQLLLMAYPDDNIDFADLDVRYSHPNIRKYKALRFPREKIANYVIMPEAVESLEKYVEIIELNRFIDALNNESTIFGYGFKTNVMVVGESWYKEKHLF